MRLSTLVKVVALVVGVSLLVVGCTVLAAINSLRDPPFDPPEVAPLGPSATFRAERVVETDAGYLLAGVVGTSDPHRGKPCSGRFALVFLDRQGRATRATIPSGIEKSQYCASRVDALLPAPGGGWFVAGTGVRDGGPAVFFGGRSTESLWVTFRADASGELVGDFGEDGHIEGHLAAGRVDGAVFTRKLARLSESGEVRDDLVASDAPLELWSAFEVENDLLVAVDFGLGLVFQAYERDAPTTPVYRPLHSLPAYQSEPTVDLGNDVSVADTLLLDGILYVAVRDPAGTRINAVDPRTLTVRFAFNGTGAVRLRGGFVTSVKLLADDGRIGAVSTMIDRGTPGQRLHLLRFATDGSLDASFGGRVQRNGRDVQLYPGVRDAVIDSAGRTLVLGDGDTRIREAPAALVRLDAAGKIDPTFGDGGRVAIRRLRPCELLPAARADSCRNA